MGKDADYEKVKVNSITEQLVIVIYLSGSL
jgi:hypothetical protein